MIRDRVNGFLNHVGYQLCSTERFGIQVEHELDRLSADDPIATVFDVGANVGQTACRFTKSFPLATIFSFEPVPETFSSMRDRTAHLPRVKPFNLALGAAAGRATMHIAESSVSSSFVESGRATGRTADVAVDTLDAFADSHGVARIDLLKIDVEGSELQVLQGSRRALAAHKIRYVYAECAFAPNPGNSQTDFSQLAGFLAGFDFCVVAVYGESFTLQAGSCLANVLFGCRSLLPRSVKGRTRNIV